MVQLILKLVISAYGIFSFLEAMYQPLLPSGVYKLGYELLFKNTKSLNDVSSVRLSENFQNLHPYKKSMNTSPAFYKYRPLKPV